MSRLRNLVFTLNNYTVEDENHLYELFKQGILAYYCYGQEIGKEGTPHLQGYAELVGQRQFTAVKKLLGPRFHIERRRGTQTQAIEYCKKSATVIVEKGEKKSCGSRSDLDAVRELAIEDGMRAVVERANLQQIRVAQEYLRYNEEPRDWEPNVIDIRGPSGVGKSRLAKELAGDTDIYWISPPVQDDKQIWFDGYDAHDTIIVNEINPQWLGFSFLKVWLDRYPLSVPIKGSFRQMRAKLIIFTSVVGLEELYFHADKEGELKRRISRRLEVDDSGVVSEVGGNTSAPPSVGKVNIN